MKFQTEELFLGDNQISGGLPVSFGESAPSLMTLSLFRNQLAGWLPSLYGFTDFWQLEQLDLSQTLLSGTIPEFIGNMTSLSKYLNCSTTNEPK